MHLYSIIFARLHNASGVNIESNNLLFHNVSLNLQRMALHSVIIVFLLLLVMAQHTSRHFTLWL